MEIDYVAEQELECLIESLGTYSEAKQRQKQAYGKLPQAQGPWL